jgi:glc operon protein GlcG
MKVLGFALMILLAVTVGSAAAAEKYAAQNNWKVVIPILDDGSNPVDLQRDDGVPIGSIEVAIRKAETSANYRQPPAKFAERLDSGATGLVGLPGALPFPGGVPIIAAGQVIGAVGVSGATAAQDAQVAQADADALPKILAK